MTRWRLLLSALLIGLGSVGFAPLPAAAQPSAIIASDSLVTPKTLVVGCLAGSGALFVIGLLPRLTGLPATIPATAIAGPATWAATGCVAGIGSGVAAILISLLLTGDDDDAAAIPEPIIEPARN